MHPNLLDESSVIYIRDQSGNYVPFTGITNIQDIKQNPVEVEPPVTYDKLAFNTDLSFTISLKRQIRKGLLDILCGRAYTKAAQRYIRWQKRQKEKERRRRLKHEACIYSDVR